MARKLKRAAKARAAPRRKATKPPSDRVLIRECVIYAQAVAAHDAGFKADPDGDSADAETLGARQMARAHLALAKITSIPATTAEGLQSKARILPMIIDDSLGSLEDNEIAFLVSFAAEVKKFLEPIINEHWSADLAARKGAR